MQRIAAWARSEASEGGGTGSYWPLPGSPLPLFAGVASATTAQKSEK